MNRGPFFTRDAIRVQHVSHVARARTGLDIPILTDATHSLLQAFRQLPGSSWIESAVDSGADWIGNAAKTPEGTIILQALTSTLAAQLAAVSIPSVDGMRTVGPQIASVVFALPGVVAGKDFADAYIQELTSRIIGTAAILIANPELATAAANSFSPAITQSINSIAASASAAQAAGQGTLSAAQTSAYRLAMATAISTGITAPLQKTLSNISFQNALNTVLQKLGVNAGVAAIRAALRDAGDTAEDVARKFGIRPDVAALAINQIAQAPVYDAGAPPPRGAAEFGVDGQPNANYTTREAAIGAPTPDVALAQAQKALSTLGLLNVFALGVAGPSTTTAIQSFQSSHGLPPTGIADAATLPVLQAAANAAPIALSSTPAENAKYAEAQARVQSILHPQGGSAHELLATLLKVSLVTSPFWFTAFVLPKLLEKRAGGAHTTAGARPRRTR